MRTCRALFCELLCGALLQTAAWMVPRRGRAEWLQEWQTELWYARQGYAAEAETAEGALLRFCLGAFEDARSLRGPGWSARAALAEVRGSARGCLASLCLLLLLALGTGLALPNVRGHLRPQHGSSTKDVVLIEDSYLAGRGHATLSLAQLLTWERMHQRIFSGFAFYSVRPARLTGETGQRPLRVAYASASAFDLLGWSLKRVPEERPRDALRPVVLTREAWRQRFHAQPDLVGRPIHLTSGTFRVAAIAPAGALRLPGAPDAWVLASGSALLPPEREGYVLGRMNPAFHEASWGEVWHMTAPLADGSASDFTCASLQQGMHEPGDLFVFAVLLALLALPATTSVPLGEYRAGTREAPLGARVRRWGFLVGKVGLLLAIVYCASLDLAFARTGISADGCAYVQMASCFGLCLWGLRWALRDQRQRCPVCLGKLSHPARVGQVSRNFLAWNGTELICAGGHGLLHVPEIATSWFGTQRWLYLDASWQVLFSEQSLLSAPYF
jgi:hypothetical protein